MFRRVTTQSSIILRVSEQPHYLTYLSRIFFQCTHSVLKKICATRSAIATHFDTGSCSVLPSRTLDTEGRAAASHITNFGLRARIARTVGALDTALALVCIEQTDQGTIPLHRFRHQLPIRRIQWGVTGPTNRICLSCRVLKLIDWPRTSRI